MDPGDLIATLGGRRDAMVESLRGLVEHESPSHDKAALDALAGRLAGQLRALGAEVARLPNPAGGDHLRALFGDAADPDAPPALILGHFDTVWPAGTLVRMPFRVEDGRAWGPGCYDMKASLVLVEHALGAIRDLGLRPAQPVVVLFTSDEEVGSPTSRALIEAEARDCSHALVVEPPLADGRLKTARKGIGRFDLEVRGRAAHAGVAPEEGISAVEELAHQVLRLHGLNDPALGTTVNVGTVLGGTAPNVVAAEASARIDLRVATPAESHRVVEAIRGLRPVHPGATLAVTGGINRPPMVRSPGVVALFEHARRLGARLGLDLGEGSTGGGSDGNFTAALGVPTLDGLGAMGAGAHADHEHVVIDSLPERAALLAALLLEPWDDPAEADGARR